MKYKVKLFVLNEPEKKFPTDIVPRDLRIKQYVEVGNNLSFAEAKRYRSEYRALGLRAEIVPCPS